MNLPWIVAPALKRPGSRVLFVVAETPEAADTIQSAHVPGLGSLTRLGPRVFGAKSGSTLVLWPAVAATTGLPMGKNYRVVFAPGSCEMAEGSTEFRLVRRYEDSQESMLVEARAFIETQAVHVTTHLTAAALAKMPTAPTIPFLCGVAYGNLRRSPVGEWALGGKSRKVKLQGALGDTVEVDSLPVDSITHKARRYVLRVTMGAIVFTEVRA